MFNPSVASHSLANGAGPSLVFSGCGKMRVDATSGIQYTNANGDVVSQLFDQETFTNGARVHTVEFKADAEIYAEYFGAGGPITLKVYRRF